MGYAVVKRPGNPAGSIWIMTTDVIPQCYDTHCELDTKEIQRGTETRSPAHFA